MTFRLPRVFAIDLRSLALFRIALGLTLAADTLYRSRELRAFYTDEGVLPASLLPLLATSGGALSFHAYASAWPAAVALLFGIQFASALALCAGFRTRAATVLCWVLLASLQLRNPQLAYSGGDRILRLLLFWSMFLPLGARFSWDARRRGAPAPAEILSVGSAALLLQIALVYVSNGLNKLESDNWIQGKGLAWALGLTFWNGPLAPWLAAQTWLMAPGSWATVAFELLAPCVAFVPWRHELLRLATVLVFFGFHVLLAAAFSIGSFPWVCMVGWLVFLPGLCWDALARRAPALAAGTATAPSTPRALEVACAALLALVFAQVAAGHVHAELPRPLRAVGVALRLQQHWGQFARVQPSDFWVTLHGTTASGAAVDPLRGGAPLQGRPARAADLFPSYLWRVYFYGLIQRAVAGPPTPTLEALTTRVADTLCWRWNARHNGRERLVGLRIAYVGERLDLAGFQPPTEVYALEWSCEGVR